MLDGHPSKFPPDERFEYCNGGYVVLALIAERASGVPYHDLVLERVCGPAGMQETDFLRSDELPGGVALGYLHTQGSQRTNVFHLPVRGNGDGGIYSPSPTSTPCGPRCSPAESSNPTSSPRWCGRAVSRRSGIGATDSGSGCVRLDRR
jgi:CubicO group peptidase (beta-lactamase class C family)